MAKCKVGTPIASFSELILDFALCANFMYHKSIVRGILSYKVNVVIKILILSDFLVFSAVNLFSPVFAIFVERKVQGAGLKDVGIATTLYFIFKAVAEMPIGAWLDKIKSETRDLCAALGGTLVMALVYFSYTFVDQKWELFVAQAVLGLAAAFAFPGWYILFTRHVDKEKEGVEWSMYDVSMGIGIGGAATLGAFIADYYGFDALFVVVGCITVVGSLLLLTIRRKLKTIN